MLPPVDAEFEARAILMIRIWDYIQTQTDLDATPEHTQRIGFIIRYQGEYVGTLREQTTSWLWLIHPYNGDASEFIEVTDAITYLQSLVVCKNGPVL